jgi:UDP-N-acetylglucosamine 1-carboxyvinyltransferase
MVVGAIASQQSVTQHLNVKGGQRLQGTLTVSGAKNSALVLMTASLSDR